MTKKKKEIDTKNAPWISNYPPLKAWLNKHNARCMWQIGMQPEDSNQVREYGYPTAYVECWLVGKALAIVIIHDNKMGWEIYTPAGTPLISETLADAERRLGLVPDIKAEYASREARTVASAILERSHDEEECNTIEDAVKLAKLVLQGK